MDMSVVVVVVVVVVVAVAVAVAVALLMRLDLRRGMGVCVSRLTGVVMRVVMVVPMALRLPV